MHSLKSGPSSLCTAMAHPMGGETISSCSGGTCAYLSNSASPSLLRVFDVGRRRVHRDSGCRLQCDLLLQCDSPSRPCGHRDRPAIRIEHDRTVLVSSEHQALRGLVASDDDGCGVTEAVAAAVAEDDGGWARR